MTVRRLQRTRRSGKLWPIWKPLCPPNHGETVTGRPLLNLSLAVNYAISGLDVWSYHATNLAIHILAALLLFGILRRTFLLPATGQSLGSRRHLLLLWPSRCFGRFIRCRRSRSPTSSSGPSRWWGCSTC